MHGTHPSGESQAGTGSLERYTGTLTVKELSMTHTTIGGTAWTTMLSTAKTGTAITETFTSGSQSTGDTPDGHGTTMAIAK